MSYERSSLAQERERENVVVENFSITRTRARTTRDAQWRGPEDKDGNNGTRNEGMGEKGWQKRQKKLPSLHRRNSVGERSFPKERVITCIYNINSYLI